MRHKCLLGMLIVLLASSNLDAQKQRLANSSEKTSDSSHSAYFIDPTSLNVVSIISPPPVQDSETTRADLAIVHHAEQTRTSEQTASARIDDLEEDIFIFKETLGADFTPEKLPLTSTLSSHIRNDEGVASKPLKTAYARPRPFQFDSTLHPVCTLTKEHNSYPSGHSLSGYLLAFTLVQIVPEKQAEIMKRADDYAHNRIICGVHYPSDIEASRNIAYLMFGYMLANPKFQRELTAAREETRSRLGLPMKMPPS
jgi:acid phosphatase (class A)